MKLLLLYNAKEEERNILENIIQGRDIELRTAGFEDLDQEIGYLIGEEGFDPKEKVEGDREDYDFTFLLLKGFEGEDLFDFLKELREGGLVIPHKATLTPTNINRSLRYLLDENDLEHRTMRLINDINALVQRAAEDKEKNGENPEIASLIKEINSYFKDPVAFDINKGYDYYEKLKSLVDQL